MRKAIKRFRGYYGFIAIIILGLAVFGLARAELGGVSIQNVEQFVMGGSSDESLGGYSATGSGSHVTDLYINNDFYVDNDAEFNATTTLQEITFGSRFSKALTFTAGSTTTPGGLFALQNTGAPKICSIVQLDISTKVEGSMSFSVGTSTSATAWSGVGANLIASTTVATATAPLLNSYDQAGSSAYESFVWDAGMYLLGAMDSDGAADNASTTDYSTAAGKMYVNCHTR